MRPGKLHVCLTIPSLRGGGAERTILNLAQLLIERGHRVDLVLPCFAGDYQAAVPHGLRVYRGRLPHTDRKFLQKVRRAGIEVEAIAVNPIGVVRTWLAIARKNLRVPVQRKRSLYASIHILNRYLCTARPHILVSALPSADAAAVCAAALTCPPIPTVVTVHTNVAIAYAPQWRTSAQTLYPLADAVVAVSQGVGESVQRALGVDAERIHVIYNGVPAEHIRRLAQEEVAHPWFETGAAPVVLSVGREGAAEGLPDPRGGVRAGAPRGGGATAHPRSAFTALPGAAQVAGGGARAWNGTSASWTSTRTRTAT